MTGITMQELRKIERANKAAAAKAEKVALASTHFRLLGQTNVFEIAKVYRAAGTIPSVLGWEINAKGRKTGRQTCARCVDVEFVPAP